MTTLIHRWRLWLPELLLAGVAAFFFFRELGTFPASWSDEGLFIIVAKMTAAGRGYVVPLLNYDWAYPYFLGVGPTLILPSALSIKLFGLSIAAARLPMTLWLIGASGLTYWWTRITLGRRRALWATGLLVTFSAFVNTGKPVLGEVPGFTFVLLFLLSMGNQSKQPVLSGLLLGLAIVTKITYGILLPALGVAWIVALIRKRWPEAGRLTVIGMLAFGTFLAWHLVEALHTPESGLLEEIQNFIFGGGGNETLFFIRHRLHLLLTLPYLAYGLLLVLGLTGLWTSRKRLGPSLTIMLSMAIGLFTLYFLNGMGWYRLLLPGHLLLLPFVPAGAEKLTGKRIGALLLTAIILAQAWWQFDHRGSSTSTGGQVVADYIQKHFADQPLLIEPTEVFARLPVNEYWLFLMPGLSFSLPEEYRVPSSEQRCLPVIRKVNGEELAALGNRAHALTGSYVAALPPADCPPVDLPPL